MTGTPSASRQARRWRRPFFTNANFGLLDFFRKIQNSAHTGKSHVRFSLVLPMDVLSPPLADVDFDHQKLGPPGERHKPKSKTPFAKQEGRWKWCKNSKLGKSSPVQRGTLIDESLP